MLSRLFVTPSELQKSVWVRNKIRPPNEADSISLAYDHIDVAEKIIQRLAVQQDKLQDGPNGDHTATSTHRLQADFWMLRIALVRNALWNRLTPA